MQCKALCPEHLACDHAAHATAHPSCPQALVQSMTPSNCSGSRLGSAYLLQEKQESCSAYKHNMGANKPFLQACGQKQHHTRRCANYRTRILATMSCSRLLPPCSLQNSYNSSDSTPRILILSAAVCCEGKKYSQYLDELPDPRFSATMLYSSLPSIGKVSILVMVL